ncbi:hypothetical protein C8F04DRAFT_1190866 [Mycena alexandri]|uniref:Uncharacterized protein n=1 Tax=Mycena alexandri TaxID=1745969 RepID=A0AAD6SIE8_9AGAR|nr:hypothetical protein C8F04DRAFT_1190866 [Mycena alexandri]
MYVLYVSTALLASKQTRKQPVQRVSQRIQRVSQRACHCPHVAFRGTRASGECAHTQAVRVREAGEGRQWDTAQECTSAGPTRTQMQWGTSLRTLSAGTRYSVPPSRMRGLDTHRLRSRGRAPIHPRQVQQGLRNGCQFTEVDSVGVGVRRCPRGRIRRGIEWGEEGGRGGVMQGDGMQKIEEKASRRRADVYAPAQVVYVHGTTMDEWMSRRMRGCAVYTPSARDEQSPLDVPCSLRVLVVRITSLDGIGEFEGNSVSVSASVYCERLCREGKGKRGDKGGKQPPAVLCAQHGVHLLVALVVWRAGDGAEAGESEEEDGSVTVTAVAEEP